MFRASGAEQMLRYEEMDKGLIRSKKQNKTRWRMTGRGRRNMKGWILDYYTGSHGRNGRQKLKQSPCRSTAYWLPLYGLSSLLSYSNQNHLSGDGTAHSELGAPTSVLNQKNSL